jgi:hypothetical protein
MVIVEKVPLAALAGVALILTLAEQQQLGAVEEDGGRRREEAEERTVSRPPSSLLPPPLRYQLKRVTIWMIRLEVSSTVVMR